MVVDFPEPVGPVTRINPLAREVSSPTTDGNPRLSKLGNWVGITRKAPATVPRCMKMLTLNRHRSFTPKLRSSSWFLMNVSRWLSVRNEKQMKNKNNNNNNDNNKCLFLRAFFSL